MLSEWSLAYIPGWINSYILDAERQGITLGIAWVAFPSDVQDINPAYITLSYAAVNHTGLANHRPVFGCVYHVR